MKKEVLFVAALACAVILTAGIVSAQPQQRTPVAGYSPNFAAPQPATKATLTPGANRLIRWQGWLDIDAFSVSILNQMQQQLGNGIEIGSFTIAEPNIAEGVMKTKVSDPTFELCEVLAAGDGINFEGVPKLFVWTYRHNFADAGLYQLYVSVKGKMIIGKTWLPPGVVTESVPHRDIQSLNYEFGNDGLISRGTPPKPRDVIVDVEIWRGAVVAVDPNGALVLQDGGPGNGSGEFGLIVNYEGTVADLPAVAVLPVSDWEVAPSLICNPNYNPKAATGAAFVEPLERKISVSGSLNVQRRAGDVQQRVRTTTPWRYRSNAPAQKMW